VGGLLQGVGGGGDKLATDGETGLLVAEGDVNVGNTASPVAEPAMQVFAVAATCNHNTISVMTVSFRACYLRRSISRSLKSIA